MRNSIWNCIIFISLLQFMCGTVMFFNGFFPFHYPLSTGKYDLNNFSKPLMNELKLEKPIQKYNRTVIVVVDALRYDFVSKNTMPLTFESACFILNLRVDSPTVTMPRIKSLMTGTLSNFVDVIFNLGHTKQLNDSLIHQLRNRGDILVFAGDQTWRLLFPNEFQRITANTDSFFVNDFYEGDRNITKVLQHELQQKDWNLMILHYLGLDHIGHVEGSTSSKIPSKLREMDDVIKLIESEKNFDNMLLLLTADHGMRNGGGHGGSTLEELHVPLAFFRKNCATSKKNDVKYNQVDVAPTLAILMSTEIPKASIGSLIPEMLEELSLEEQLYAYYCNAMHLINKTIDKFGMVVSRNSPYFSYFEEAKIFHKRFLQSKDFATTLNRIYFENAKMKYNYASRQISEILSSSLVKYNYKLIISGLLLTCLAWTCMMISTFCLKNVHEYPPIINIKWLLISFGIALGFIISLNIFQSDGENVLFINWVQVLLLMSGIYLIKILTSLSSKFILEIKSVNQLLLLVSKALLICYGFCILSQCSSSFIEKEHYTWYYLGSTIFLILITTIYFQNIKLVDNKNVSLKILINEIFEMRLPLLMLIIQIILKNFNNTDKWNGSNFADFLNKSENKIWLSLVSIIAFLCLLRNICRGCLIQGIGSKIAVLCIYSFHGLEGKLTFFYENRELTKFVLATFLLTIIIIIYRKKDFKKCLEVYEICILLISCILQKPHNLILIPLLLFTLNENFKMCSNFKVEKFGADRNFNIPILKTLSTIFIIKMFYFYQGNSNSLATVDLNPGFIGQSNYNPYFGATLITLNTYYAHFNGFIFLISHLIKNNSQPLLIKELNFVIGFYIILSLFPVVIYFWLMITFRHHLFIYSVFAPKLLYESFSVIIVFINVLISIF